jgi:hypothetical protein
VKKDETEETPMREFKPFTTPALEAFVPLVEKYCALIEGQDTLSPSDLLVAAHNLVAQLYATGLALPPTDILLQDDADDAEDHDAPIVESCQDLDRGDHQEWSMLYHALDAKLGNWSAYREVFNPYEPPSKGEVTGSLADDFADIYRDLRAGLRKWQRGDSGTAFWEWRFHLEHHWGEHATSALRALNALTSNGETPWPASG